MKNLRPIITAMKKEIQTLDNNEGKRLHEINLALNSMAEDANEYEDLWLGGWGKSNFNVYRNPRNQNENIQVNPDFFYGILEKKNKTSIDKFDKEIDASLTKYKKFQTTLITELAAIRDSEGFKNELELLISIENFKWGMDSSDYIRLRRPSQIPIYDLSVLNKGVQTPPHIAVIAYLASLATKAYSVKNFEESVTRLLRQLEIKLGGDSVSDNSSQTLLKIIFDNFHHFCNQLKNRYSDRASIEVNDEYDVQDLLHAILRLHFKDVRKEEYTPSYAGSSTRVDFLLKDENIVIEVKKTRDKLADSEIGKQLILDVTHYKNHPNCKALKCFVYDPENRIKNPVGLENDLNKLSTDEMTVEVFIRP